MDPLSTGRSLIGRLLALILPAVLLLAATSLNAQPLASWNEGPTKSAILKFVTDVTTPGAPGFVEKDQRIAVFDNDGTLWAEQPIYFQFAFAIDRVRELAPAHPEWKGKPVFDAILKGDMKGMAAAGEKGLAEVLAVTHAGMSTDEFSAAVAHWLVTSRHPRFQRRYDELVYQPMRELLDHLNGNGFKTFIVSGGGIEFMRVFAQRVYGIPPEQVIGSTGQLKLGTGKDGQPVLIRLPQIDLVDDKAGKPVGIQRFIGRRPILAFGNSDGDLQMLQWTAAGSGLRFIGIVHHTDGDREFAYDRKSRIGTLDKAWDEGKARGWTIVDMKQDWRQVFPGDRP
ncbi:HAD family hydrolase [Variovorax sp. GB1R11]|uniref:HAD family hydrolase n=1 Tax=Variovorax sp. GB1R11 TaxID=3443741 RepID=UPI003F481258